MLASFAKANCESPVMPGLTRRSLVVAAQSRTKRGISGRGPTRLISPLRTCQSCGSSSILVRTRTRPTLVGDAGRRPRSARDRTASRVIFRRLNIDRSRPRWPTRRRRKKSSLGCQARSRSPRPERDKAEHQQDGRADQIERTFQQERRPRAPPHAHANLLPTAGRPPCV